MVNALTVQVRSTSISKTKRSASSAAQAVMGNVQLAPLANIGTDTEQISASGVGRVQLGIVLQARAKFTRSNSALSK